MVLAASCWQCCTSGPNIVRNAAVSGTSSETSFCSRPSGNMSSVRSGYSADWEAGMWPGCHAPCSKLARVETIWVMRTDSTVDSGGTSSRLPKQIARSHGHGLLADGLGQHGAPQVHGGHMVGQKTERDDIGWAASLAPQQTD